MSGLWFATSNTLSITFSNYRCAKNELLSCFSDTLYNTCLILRMDEDEECKDRTNIQIALWEQSVYGYSNNIYFIYDYPKRMIKTMNDSSFYPGVWKGLGACLLFWGMSMFLGVFDWMITSITHVQIGLSLFLSAMCAWFVLNLLQKHNVPTFSYQFKVKYKKLFLWLFLAAIGLILGVSIPIQESLPSIPILDKLIKDIMEGLLQLPVVVLILSTVVMAPVFEELIFRGILLNGFMHRYSKVKAVLLASVLFALTHGIPQQMITAFILGCYLGWIYAKTRNSTLTIAAHFFNNGLAVLMSVLLLGDKALTDSEMSFYASVTSKYGFVASVIIVLGALVLLFVSLYQINKLLKKEGFAQEEDIQNADHVDQLGLS